MKIIVQIFYFIYFFFFNLDNIKNNIAIHIAGKVLRYIDASMDRATPTSDGGDRIHYIILADALTRVHESF